MVTEQANITEEFWQSTLQDIAKTKYRIWQLECKIQTLEVILGFKFMAEVQKPNTLRHLMEAYNRNDFETMEDLLHSVIDFPKV